MYRRARELNEGTNKLNVLDNNINGVHIAYKHKHTHSHQLVSLLRDCLVCWLLLSKVLLHFERAIAGTSRRWHPPRED